MKKTIILIVKILISAIIVVSYPIYAIVVWHTSKSPDDISKFPTSGIWVCVEETFTMTIDLRNIKEDENVFSSMVITLERNDSKQILDCYQTSGHGTPLAPTAPSHILTFESKDIGKVEKNYVEFSTHKYKFNENDFYLLDVSIPKNNNANIFKENMDLRFSKQN